jgi:tetratricopeptide (TPR) repeat protein
MHVAPPTPTEEDYTPQDTQETIDLIASALAQPPASPAASPEPVQLSAPDPMDDAADTEADAPVPAAPEAPKVEIADSAAAYDEETTPSAPVAADSEGLKERMAPRLSEAEQLMAALDAGRETIAEAPAPVSHEAAPETQPAEPDPAEDSYEDKAPIWSPEPVPPEVLDDDADAEPGMPQNQTLTEPRGTIQYSYSAAPSRRRSSKGGRKKRRALRLLGILTLVCMIAAGICGAMYFFILPSMAPPENMFAEGQKHWQSEEYEAAAADFALFAQRHPNHPDRADALFRAGLALQTAPAESRDARDRLNQQALTIYQQFIEANPVHPKAPRAETLIGVLMFELGDYEKAITFLRDPARRVKDPDAGLARLRTLGDAYSKLGNVEDAESTYLQAAVLPGNYTRDVDYTALGDLFSRHAEMTEAPEVREDYLGKAAEYWRLTLALPSASPRAKSEVETKLNLLSAISDEAATVTPEEVTEDLPDMTAPVQANEVTPGMDETPEPAATESEEATSPAQSTVSVQEPDPTEEAAFLEGAS